MTEASSTPNRPGPTLILIRQLLAKSHDTLTWGQMFVLFHEAGPSIFTLFLCLPFLQPLMIPGVSVPFGVLIALSAVLHAFDYPAKMPERWSHREFSVQNFKKLLQFLEKYIVKFEHVIHPRAAWFVRGRFCRWVSCLMVAVSGILLSLPLPIPFSNSVPAVVIGLLSLGQLEEDSFLIALGSLCFLACLGFFAALGLGVYRVSQ